MRRRARSKGNTTDCRVPHGMHDKLPHMYGASCLVSLAREVMRRRRYFDAPRRTFRRRFWQLLGQRRAFPNSDGRENLKVHKIPPVNVDKVNTRQTASRSIPPPPPPRQRPFQPRGRSSRTCHSGVFLIDEEKNSREVEFPRWGWVVLPARRF